MNAVFVKIGTKKALLLGVKNALGHQLNWLRSPKKPMSSLNLAICARVDAFIAYPGQMGLYGLDRGFSRQVQSHVDHALPRSRDSLEER
jgi:hypothetical protein